jgi:phosphate transport system protein
MSDPNQHLVRSFDEDLRRLRDLITQMGGIVENQMALAAEAILSGNAEAASRTLELDPRVDALEREVEQFVVRLLALRQPMADDLRHIVAALKITDDLERVGDYAANIAKRSLVLNEFALRLSLPGLRHMIELVQVNLKRVIDAAGAGDAEQALDVWRSDERIDEMYNALFRELITYMMEDPRSITPCTHLLFIAKNLERVGDHATNVAETVYYAVTGEALTENRPKGDNSPYAVVRPQD